MANYYPLISKAVAGLEKNTGEARRALYERARTALVTQLRGMTPALGESDITRERLALEEAIRRIEAEAARSSRLEPIVRDKPKPPEPVPPRNDPQPAPAPAPEDKSAEPKKPDTPPPPPRPSRPNDGRSLSDQGLKGFRDVVAEAETLGEATAQASKSARAAFASVPSPGAEKERTEPHIEPEGLRPPPRRPAPAPPRVPVPPREPPNRESGRSAAVPAPARGNDSPRDAPMPREPARGLGGMGLDARPEDMRLGEDARPREPEERERDYSAPDFQERPFPLGRDEGRRHQPVLQDDQIEPEGGGRQWGPLIAIAGVVVLALAIIGVGVWQWPTLMGMFKSTPAVVTAPPASAPQTAPGGPRKDPGRLGAQNAPAPQPQGAAVAQRVVLYEEDPADPAGKRYVGSAVWRTEQVAAAPGQPADMAVRAEIEIPERKMTMKWSLRRNTDKGLPASHTVEIIFQLPPDFPHGGISNIPGILMKQAEQTRGVPLAGLSVKVTDLFFLIGLSSVEADMQRNVQLLKERSWFDVPVVYTDGRRAIMAVEKGNPGDRAFADAFAAWGQ